jgi:hypothetical protein
MNSIQIKGVDSTLSQVVAEDVRYLKQHLDNIFSNSETTFIDNCIQETEILLEQVNDTAKSYQEKYAIFQQVTQSWYDVWSHYKHIPAAIDLGEKINHITDSSTAYSYLCLSVSLINEGRTNDYKTDLERIVSGFLFLSEIIDVFVEFFSQSELAQIYDGAQNAIAISQRTVREYFEKDVEISNTETQLRAYSSLIVLKIDEYLKKAEAALAGDSIYPAREIAIAASTTPWWEKIVGTFADNPVYDEAMRLGREYRESLRADSTD